MIYVVGSGPSAVSCAMPLAARGLPVTLIDAGIELEADRQRQADVLESHPPEAWDAVDPLWRQRFKRYDLSRYDEGGPAKAVFGSFFPYAEAERIVATSANRSALWPSLAKGGFSNVWGGAVLPCLEADMEGWPITLAELAPHYAAVLKWMPFSARHDGLEARFPLHAQAPTRLEPSRQAAEFLADLELQRAALRSNGVEFGYSRLAVQGHKVSQSAARGGPEAGAGCVYCTLCLQGCPYHLIYNSQSTLKIMLDYPNVRYLQGILVTRIEERGGAVVLTGENRATGAAVSLKGESVFLACGVLSTAKILLGSRGDGAGQISVLDSQYFYLPLLRFRGTQGVESERAHTLAQAFLEITDPLLSKNTVHLQVYTFNDLYADALKDRLGKLYAMFKPFERHLLSRMLVIQGYLHSNDSSRLLLSIAKDGGRVQEGLQVDVALNPKAAQVVRRVCAKLRRLSGVLRAVPLAGQVALGRPGRGTHCGGSFPMRSIPRDGEASVLGVPHGFSRVHVVDSSVLPSIPATTITLTVMANAHRIASCYLDS